MGLPFYLDIIELIIDVFARRRDMDMLAALSLVSRFTRRISRPHIFKVVDLQSCTDPFKQQQRSELLDNLLKRHPDLGGHVKEIRLGDCRIPPDKKANIYSRTHDARRAENRLLLVSQMESCYVSILSSLPNIRGFRFIAKHQNKLDWADEFPESLQQAIANIMRKPDLTAFSIAGISGFPQYLLLDLTQIQVLEIWDSTFAFPASQVEFPTSNLFLKHLVVATGDRPDNGLDSLIHNFMERSAETLEHITWIMDNEHEDTVTVDFNSLQRLRSLCLQVTASGPQGAVPRLLRQLSLAQSSPLEYITFSVKNAGVSMFDSYEEDVKDRWKVIDSILTGPSFHRLRRIKILAMDWPFLGQHAEVFHGLCERRVEICVDARL
ncbi:hypothetical protein BYT27DRAFT_7197592, partial [Phlegmacium glaucopus]